MSDAPDKDQKQFDPTARRMAKAREDGQVASSKDLAGSIQLLTALVLLATAGGVLYSGLGRGVQRVIERVVQGGGRSLTFTSAFHIAATEMVVPMLGFVCVCAAVVVFAQWSQTRFNWAPKALAPKLDKLNVVKRFGQVFAPKKMAVGLALSLLKVSVTAAVVYGVLANELVSLAALSMATPDVVIGRAVNVLGTMAGMATVLFLAVSGLDLAWQRRQHWESLKMTRKEMEDENTEQEGHAQTKGRRKKMHRELSMNQILDAVPKATVVVTNPTHLAIALRYQPGVDSAPVVTAKGADAMAAHIRALARQHGVPIVEHKPLARVLFGRVKVGGRVPSTTYQLVAEVLARVYRARGGIGA